MNFCPECGGGVECTDVLADVATTHDTYTCTKCKTKWQETILKSTGEILHICPIGTGD